MCPLVFRSLQTKRSVSPPVRYPSWQFPTPQCHSSRRYFFFLSFTIKKEYQHQIWPLASTLVHLSKKLHSLPL